MLAKDAIEFLKTVPPDYKLCFQSGSEFFPIDGLQVKKAYHGSGPWLYSGVEFPSDWSKTEVVKIIPQRKT